MRNSIFLFMIAASLALAPALAAGTAEGNIRKAQEYENQGRHIEAERYYVQAIKEAYALGQNNHKIPDVLFTVAEYYRTRENFGKAEEYYLKALNYKKRFVGENHFDLSPFYLGLGLLYQAEKKFYAAQTQFECALELYRTKLKADRDMPLNDKRTINLGMASCISYLADAKEQVEGFFPAQILRDKVSRIQANPTGDFHF